MQAFRVIVVGGGHAGVEAAWAAANLLTSRGCGPGSVALVTLDPSKIGEMSCNPAIGGLAKGQLVREVDALGGLMGLATDATGINFKVLNQSKGPASQGPRAQCDKHAYARAVRTLIHARPEITIIAGSVERLIVEQGVCQGCDIALAGGGTQQLRAGALVLTTGTFMRGLMHTGETKREGGRFGEGAAIGISHALRELGFELGRLKTGTPPRLRRDSISWHALEPQWGDEQPHAFSDLTACASWIGSQTSTEPSAATALRHAAAFAPSLLRFPVLTQVDCRLTSTTPIAHDTIRANLHRAPMFSGQIEGAGPRYCPSIEDKVVRFAERSTHGVFLEPESHESDWVYCNGISTSLPSDVQDAIVRNMPGCEHAEILRYGYAVEYDMVRPHQILATGQTRLVPGLFLAGQINGTSGYEEAAAQGLIAGLNAALSVQSEPEVIFGRDEAYLGVLMDDLVTKTPVEPYRMFTSRAEHRLLLRSDNAPERLTPRAIALGLLRGTLLGELRLAAWQRRSEQRAALGALIDTARVPTAQGDEPLEKLLRGQAFDVADLAREAQRAQPHANFDPSVLRLLHAERRYAAYIIRQQNEVKRQAAQEHRTLPATADYLTMPHLRTEARQALHRFRPRTFGQAARLEGITPADITLLSVLVGRS